MIVFRTERVRTTAVLNCGAILPSADVPNRTDRRA
jgi:hypothetical protein